jgi:DNA-binding response OmpR family regulator
MANTRLLLIEDDFDVAEMLLMYFQALSYEVLHAENGTQGIEIARTKFPNLILLDVMLPDMDGYDICDKLRNMSLTKYIPILFLTQKDERSSKVKGLQLGADDYITKPFDIDELRLRVDGSIRRATRENLHESRTGLPTGQLAEEELQKYRQQSATILRFKLSGFSAYTDVYSFMAANDVMFHAGKTIRDVLAEQSLSESFIGIIGDEFMVATKATDVQLLENTIKDRFQKQVKTFYTFSDADKGGILLDEGTDTERFVPIMSLVTQAEPSAV